MDTQKKIAQRNKQAFAPIAARIAAHAEANGYRNVRALCLAAGFSDSTYFYWRTGRNYPNLRSLDRIFAQGPASKAARRNGRRTA